MENIISDLFKKYNILIVCMEGSYKILELISNKIHEDKSFPLSKTQLMGECIEQCKIGKKCNCYITQDILNDFIEIYKSNGVIKCNEKVCNTFLFQKFEEMLKKSNFSENKILDAKYRKDNVVEILGHLKLDFSRIPKAMQNTLLSMTERVYSSHEKCNEGCQKNLRNKFDEEFKKIKNPNFRSKTDEEIAKDIFNKLEFNFYSLPKDVQKDIKEMIIMERTAYELQNELIEANLEPLPVSNVHKRL